MVRGALATLLSLEPGIKVCGQADSSHEALGTLGGMVYSQDSAPTGAACIRPVDVILLDVEMPAVGGIAVCEAVRMRFLGIRVLMLTTFGRPGYVQRSLDAGAGGSIVKDISSKQLAEVVRRINASHRVINPTLAVEVLSFGVSSLTEYEAKVLHCVAESGTPADIASELGLSRGTVHNHVLSAMSETNARTRAQTLRFVTGKRWL